MAADDSSLIEILFKGAMGLASAGFWFMQKDMKDNIKDIDKKQQAQAEKLADFQLHVVQNYPKETTMARLYEKIEQMAEDLNDLKVMVGKKSGH